MSSNNNGRDSDSAYPYFSQNDSYDLNSRIMFCSIVFLTIVIILAFVHHVYTKFTRRPAPPHSAQTTTALAAEVAVQDDNDPSSSESPKLGLHPLVIASLPTFVVPRSSNDNAIVKNGSMMMDSGTECPICLNGLEDEEVGRVLPNCRHVFHASCVDMWLVSNSTCPVCRMEVVPAKSQQLSAGASSASPPAASPLPVDCV